LKCAVSDTHIAAELTFQGLDIGRVEPNDDLVDRIVDTTADEYPLAPISERERYPSEHTAVENRGIETGYCRSHETDSRRS